MSPAHELRGGALAFRLLPLPQHHNLIGRNRTPYAGRKRRFDKMKMPAARNQIAPSLQRLARRWRADRPCHHLVAS